MNNARTKWYYHSDTIFTFKFYSKQKWCSFKLHHFLFLLFYF